MHLRSVLSGTLALLLLSGVTAPASGLGASGTGQSTDSGFSFHLPSIELPKLFGEKKKPDQVQMVQSDPTAVTSLEDQLRQMNGKIEELNFQVLQMQEQIRKQQEDNEFRFQQLEGGSQGGQTPAAPKKKSDATTDTNTDVAAAPATQAPADAGAAPGSDQSTGGKTVEDVIVESPEGDPGKVIPGTGAPEKTFGSITVDKNGNVIDAGGNTQSTAPTQDAAPATKAPAKAGKSEARSSRRCLPPRTRKNSTAIPISSSCRAITAPPNRVSAIISPASPRMPRRRTRITGWVNRCLASRNTATRPRSSLPPARTTRRPRRRPTCF